MAIGRDISQAAQFIPALGFLFLHAGDRGSQWLAC